MKTTDESISLDLYLSISLCPYLLNTNNLFFFFFLFENCNQIQFQNILKGLNPNFFLLTKLGEANEMVRILIFIARKKVLPSLELNLSLFFLFLISIS